MLNKLLILALFFVLDFATQSYAQTSCEAPSCSALTITGPDKVSYGQSVSYTLTGGTLKNIRWSVDNPGAYISGDNKGAILTVSTACDCNNGTITITAKDTQTGCSGTFRVQAGTWVMTSEIDYRPGLSNNCEIIIGSPSGCLFDISSCNKTIDDTHYDYYEWGCANVGFCGPPCPSWTNPSGCIDTRNCETTCDSYGRCGGKVLHIHRTYGWKCPTSSQSCSTTCSLSITDFKTSAATFDPYSETVCLSGLVDEATGKSVGWTIEIKNGAGEVVKQFSGGAAYVGASWSGRDDNGEIVPDGIYTAVLTAKTGNGECTTKRELDVTVQSKCRFTISTDPKEVWPQIPATQRPTGYMEDWNKAKILVSLTKPAPLGGCNIDFTVEPVENTGGHDHSGGRPKGTVEPANVNIPSGTEGTIKAAVYKSNEISGEEKIVAKMKDKDGNEKTIDDTTIKVWVKGLGSLGGGTNLITWTSTEKYHKLANSNYGTSATIGNVQYAVGKYVEDYELIPTVKLAVVDMSLPWGGLFDVDGNWSPSHDYHRVGKSVDFSKYYRDDKGNVISVGFFSDDGDLLGLVNLIDQKKLDKYFAEKKCARWEKSIGKIHYECPK